jgi:hypothetical protein
MPAKTHGLSHTPLYYVWQAMWKRCRDTNDPAWKNYGGRGIVVCSEWSNYAEFHAWAMAHGYRAGLTLDRSNNDGSYDPRNCSFVTRAAQNRNTRRNHYIEIFGDVKLQQDWAIDARCVVDAKLFRNRIRLGWPPEKALTVPASYLNSHDPEIQSYRSAAI